jgi:flagellar biosynthesis protein FliQ
MIDLALQFVTFVGAVIIIALAEININETTFKNRPRFVIAFVFLAGAWLWQAMEILAGAVPDVATAYAAAGLAILLIEERRCPRSCALKGQGYGVFTMRTADNNDGRCREIAEVRE